MLRIPYIMLLVCCRYAMLFYVRKSIAETVTCANIWIVKKLFAINELDPRTF